MSGDAIRQDFCEQQIGDKCGRDDSGSYRNRVAAFACKECKKSVKISQNIRPPGRNLTKVLLNLS
jgi:hypothetical protein